MTAMLDDEIAELRRANAELQRANAELQGRLNEALAERDEFLQRETATTEVLQVINSSPGDLAPVFEAILENALRVCEAAFGFIATYDGQNFHHMAGRGLPPAFAEILRTPYRPPQGSPAQRLIDGESFVQIADLLEEEGTVQGLTPVRRALVGTARGRTFLTLGLRKESVLFGSIMIYRQEVRPFSYKQIGLLQNFAAQAVIAMENARLITETREALEQQTATAEVLQVINSSPGDLAPVFQAMLEKAQSLCGSGHGTLFLRDGDYFRPAAMRGVPEPIAERLRGGISGPDVPVSRPLLAGERFVHIIDTAQSDHPMMRLAKENGARALLSVPLRKGSDVLGMIVAGQIEGPPFSDKQIALLENFAAQAVIAMENARLLTETRDALEKQTATAEILRVISRSPTDLQPTFDAIVANATILSGAEAGGVFRFDGSLIHFVAHHGYAPDVLDDIQRDFPIPPGRHSTTARAILTREVAHIPDAAADPEYGLRAILQTGVHTMLSVPILRDGNPVGAITVTRREVSPFSQTQIDLLKTFADQAVIAIENVRLFNETREALEQQTATSEVLQVINSSPGDLAPVFEAILEKARAVCGLAQGSLNVYDGEYFRTVATRGIPEPFAEVLRQPRRAGPQARFLEGERIVHIADAAAERPESDDPVYCAAIEAGVRTVLFVPLRNEKRLLGYITANRREVRPFSEKEIALLENFAAQAVIAMENARLLTETREALEQQTATAEVLQVINSSPGDLEPVFDAMLGRALRLCQAEFGNVATYDGERFTFAAVAGHSEFSEWARRNGPGEPRPGTTMERTLRGENVIHIRDMADDEGYRSGTPVRRALVEIGGFRSLLCAALRKDDRLLGMFHIYRQEVRAFSDKEIALLQNFAAQAVIAMENARLLDEIRQRQAELRVTFDNMGRWCGDVRRRLSAGGMEPQFPGIA